MRPRSSLVCIGWTIMLLGGLRTAAAQGAELPDSLVSLNRAGDWRQAAALADAYLAVTPPPRVEARCRARASQLWAVQRLHMTDSSRALLREFDRECATVAMRDEVRDVARVREELAVAPRAGFPAAPPAPAGSGSDFRTSADPTTLGVDTSVLRQHRTLCETTGADACLVVVRGRMVQEWYAPRFGHSPPRMLYAMSSTKSITGLLVGMLIADGKIHDVDQRVCAYLSTWCAGMRARVTLRHLLSMTSGLPMMKDSSVGFTDDKDAFVLRLTPTRIPGTTWAYSNEGAQLLSPILDAAAGEPIQDYARRRLFEPLGMRDTRLHVDVRNHAWTYADMETTPRDLARIGLLMLQRGRWENRQIVPAAWIDSSTHPSQRWNDRYGLLWWIDPEARAFAAHGHLDTDIHVLPSSGLVVVRMQAAPMAGVREGAYEEAALPLYRELVRAR